MKHNAHWFRSDLRITDNPALDHASRELPCIGVYLLTAGQWDKHGISPAKRSLIARQLRSLDVSLKKLNIPLIVLDCGLFSDSPKTLLAFCQQFNIRKLTFNIEYELNEKKCADAVVKQLEANGIETAAFHDQCLATPGTIRTQDNKPYKVFSAFKRTFIGNMHRFRRPLAKVPRAQTPLGIPSNLKALDKLKLNSQWDSFWPASEKEAHKRLNRFMGDNLLHYDSQRDHPSLEGTSTLSPWLSIGAISANQCLHAVESNFELAQKGAETWINELIWRDFYRHLVYDFPYLCQHKPFKPRTDALPWKHDAAVFERWCNGETGFPIIDAAMKQLLETAWMHNRLRMVVSMFLTKDLFIDWRLGEKYFMSLLVDGDFASNNGGWQWSASTGVDAVPYFRVFNPTRQSQRFDADGKFLRKYLPQLSSLENKAIHEPRPEDRAKCAYPSPMVDHKLVTAQVKALFANYA